MRIVCLAVLLFTQATFAQLSCPFDEKVRALADDATSLEAIAKALQNQKQVKDWVASERASCKVETKLRVVRTLDGLSQRCATALVELELTESECKNFIISNDGGPPRAFAMVAPDAKGKLLPVWTLWLEDEPLPPPHPAAPIRSECAHAIGPRDAGSPPGLLAIASDSTLRFDACTLRGVPEEIVRRALLAALKDSDNASVACRFYEADAGYPTCALTTHVTEKGVAVVHTAGFRTNLYPLDPPHFLKSASYFELTDAGARWLCNDLGLSPWGEGEPLGPPLAARQGCTPVTAKQRLLSEAAKTTFDSAADIVWRRELSRAPAVAAALQVERLGLDSGYGILNEADLASKVRDSVALLGRCAKAPWRYDGALGAVTAARGSSVAVIFRAEPGDEACLASAMQDELRRFRPRFPERSQLSIYRFRLGLVDRPETAAPEPGDDAGRAAPRQLEPVKGTVP